jgi:hypothetical protein
MVKGSPHVVLDAGDQSASRTLPVSQKMTEGMSIVPVVQSNGKYSAQFDSERLIHGKIREYTLRSAAHWNQVNKIFAHSAAVSQPASNNDQVSKTLSADNFFLIASTLPAGVLSSVGFPQIQKGLREFVIAHMIRDTVYVSQASTQATLRSFNNGASASYQRLRVDVSGPFSGALKTGLQYFFPEISGKTNAGTHSDVEQISFPSYAGENHNGSTQQNEVTTPQHEFSSGDKLSALVCLLTSYGVFSASKVPLSKNRRKRTSFLDSKSKLVFSQGLSGRLGTPSHPFASKDVCGFGTAPIWYQQSMATGPPTQAISLEI